MSNEPIYFRSRDGVYYTEKEVGDAFYIATGMRVEYFYEEYQNWVQSRCMSRFFEKCNTNEIEITATLHKQQPALAVKLYRERNGCTLREAHEKLETLFGPRYKSYHPSNTM